MPIKRANGRRNVSTVFTHRGGKVSLFNYNPSIAGGSIAIKRLRLGRKAHAYRRGGVVDSTINSLNPNVNSAAMSFAPSSNVVSNTEHRKRLRSMVSEQLEKAHKKQR